MANRNQSEVVSENGLRGTILGPSDASPDEIAISLEDGREISVPPSALTLRPEGGWSLRAGDSLQGEIVLPVISEELEVGKRKRETGTVRVEKESIAHEETVSMPLTRETADVRRVVINRQVEGPLPVRREGDTIIMPVVEEVAVVEKRMMLKEEIHITRRRTTQQHEETVTLHTEQAAVERLDSAGQPQPVHTTSPSNITSSQPAASPQPAVLPPQERSLVDPTKPRPSLLGPRSKTTATKKSLLKKS